MKKMICGVFTFVLLAGGLLGCSQSVGKVPARGVWEDRTYTNAEAGIRLTVPEGYYINSDEEIISWGKYSEDYFYDVKNTDDYIDVYLSSGETKMFINYKMVREKDLTSEQYINRLKSDSKTVQYGDAELNIIYGDTVEKVFCGQTYAYYSITLEGADDFYRGRCVRITSEGVLTFINIVCENEEQVNAYLAFFGTASVG